MKKGMIILFAISSLNVFSQNLVPNPSFEIAQWDGNLYGAPITCAPPWYNAYYTNTTPDYFNPNYWSYAVNIPSRTGDGLARVVVGKQGAIQVHREYPQVKLSQPLVAGKVYHVGYYYCVINIPYHANIAVMNIGFRFSNDSLLYPSWLATPPVSYTGYLGNNPPYSYTQDTSLFQLPTDTFSYMKLEHYYTAQGGEEFLTLGNFNHIDSTYLMTITPQNQNQNSFLITYYIDDVFVLDVEQLQDTDLVYIDTFNVGVPITYNCIENSCIDPSNATGIYSTLADCQAVCGVNTIEENNTTKQLLKITDVLGRESKPTPNAPLFYRYSDGTVEKRIVIE